MGAIDRLVKEVKEAEAPFKESECLDKTATLLYIEQLLKNQQLAFENRLRIERDKSDTKKLEMLFLMFLGYIIIFTIFVLLFFGGL